MITVVQCEAAAFKDAKLHLLSLKGFETTNSDGDLFRFTKQVVKALSDKARDQSAGKEVHWAAVSKIEELCRNSVLLWSEKPRNGSTDIDRYVKHGAAFEFSGERYVAKITSKVYPGDPAHVTYSVEALTIEKNGARGITDSILARGQSLDPDAVDRIRNFLAEVNGDPSIS